MAKPRKFDIDWEAITIRVYSELLTQSFTEFPINPLLYRKAGVLIISYTRYSKLSGIPLYELLDELPEEGFACVGLRPDLRLLMYDDTAFKPRKLHTLSHEIGHLVQGHTQHGAQEEIEANAFAAQFRSPSAIIFELRRRGYTVSEDLLIQVFGLSKESASKRMDYIMTYSDIHRTDHDELIVHKFVEFLDKNYPPMADAIFDVYNDDIGDDRSKWTYSHRR